MRDVLAKICDRVFPDEIAENRRLHEVVTRGVQVDQVIGGETVGAVARLVDWENRENDWLAVNQVEIAGKSVRQPDVLLYLNGLPLVVVELKGTEGNGPRGRLQPDRDLQAATSRSCSGPTSSR